MVRLKVNRPCKKPDQKDERNGKEALCFFPCTYIEYMDPWLKNKKRTLVWRLVFVRENAVWSTTTTLICSTFTKDT
jgi:hypothetical protein